MGYSLEQEKYNITPLDHQTKLKLDWKIHCIMIRASEIAKEARVKLGMEHECSGFDITCDCEMPEFQAELHPAHTFNKYLMEQRIRYGGSQ
jgi:hypothetical protein